MKTVKNLFVGVILGILFVIGGVFILFFNERNSVKNIKSISEARNVLVLAETAPIKSENEGSLVALNGKLSYDNEYLYDSFFGVRSEKKTYKMQRFVEMYQWKEENDSDSKDKSVYKKVWRSSIINSDLFNDKNYVNPSVIPYDSLVIYADNVELGDYAISSDNLKSVLTDEDVLITDASLPLGYSLQRNYITNSNDISSPEIGDIRISYKMVNSNDFSIVAMQTGNTLIDYITEQGKTIHLSSSGLISGSELINKLESDNTTLKWILRIVGIVLISFGFAGLISPINKILNLVPFVGNRISGLLSLMALLLGSAVSFIIIGISWVIYRPVLGVLLLILATLFIVGLVYLVKKNKHSESLEPSIKNFSNSSSNAMPELQNQEETAPTIQDVPLQPWEQGNGFENTTHSDTNTNLQNNDLK